MNLEFPVHEVTENGGPVVLAQIATCSCVDGESFKVYQVAGQNHYHIECIDCETAFCPFGVCVVPNAWERLTFEENGQWWHYDETGADRYGPFPDQAEAVDGLKKYSAWLASER